MDDRLKKRVSVELKIQFVLEDFFFLLTIGLYIRLRNEYEDELDSVYRTFLIEQLLT